MRNEPGQPSDGDLGALESLGLMTLPGFLIITHPGREPRGDGGRKGPGISISMYKRALPRPKDNTNGTASR